MAFGVFIHRSDSIYNDSPAEHYQFPAIYRSRVEACVGDWIIYYEPTKVLKTRGYFAIAKIQKIVPDPNTHKMHLAVIEPGSYLDFAHSVAFNLSGEPIERGLLNEEGKISGRRQSAVRAISNKDFHRIIEIGLAEDEIILPRLDSHALTEFEEEQAPFGLENLSARPTYLMNRVIRDRVFRRVILRAYNERCSMTGLKLINGGGRAEVEAAHIRPVAANGPDIVNNGIALSGTAHWMFDRGLIGITDNLKILVSRQINDPESVQSLLNQSGYLHRPQRPGDRPHPSFLAWHRENCFKN